MVFEKIREIIASQFDIDEEKITMETTVADDLGADSLDVVEVLMSVEDEFSVEIPDEAKPVVYLAGMDKDCRQKAFEIATALRKAGIFAEIDHMERSIKAQFKYADKIGAKYVAVLGGNELAEGAVNVKNLFSGESEKVAFDDLVTYFSGK